MIHDLVIAGTIAGAQYAERFGLRFYQDRWMDERDKKEVDDSLEDELAATVGKDIKLPVDQIRKRVLFYFQREVMNNFGIHILESAGATDDLLDDDDINVVEMYKVFKEFTLNNPLLDVLSMWPIDMNGSFAFVVSRKPMSA
ncbi:hypothetical protein [Pseudomonas phage PA1C]|uniref:Uncharacterized protein n=1 Tax=Pseudomonas phage vB_PaeM_PS119XW TaxID=2601632 RepID=A0A5C1K7A4_9CAUD|nr:hypothetical protein PP933_gp046 [Pseudomonas phage vB_PaeM_PS119XW]QBX32198.1 hypothetical protein [Pseudomonas phage PA1C]QEM41775.1 hypothetical protein [Pseudomonas phage vB_PaeM_PS119XW]BEG72686.1 hypothetical protein RVBP21_3140 [Pseudomonas phage BRkr]